MKFDFNPKRVAFLDFETQSEVDIDTVTKYAKHPSTRALTCCVLTDDGEMHRLGPYLGEPELATLRKLAAEYTLVAHNATFDGTIWELTCGLPEATWFDTLPCARAAGLPGKLDDIGTLLTGAGKDKNGKLLIELLCKIKNGRVPAIGPAHKMLLDYNARDSELLGQIFERVKGYGEPDVIEQDYIINKRGIPADRKMLEQIRDLFISDGKRLEKQFSEHTGGVNPKSAKQVKDWMRRLGFAVDSISRFGYKDFVDKPDDYWVGDESDDKAASLAIVLEAMEERRGIARVGLGKVEAGLRCLESDDRIRDQFVYWGAHTGRWSGRDLQLHNMPKGLTDGDYGPLGLRDLMPTYDIVMAAAARARELVPTARCDVADILNTMLRHVVRSDNLLVADYGAVEARGAAFMAGAEGMLEVFRDPSRSVYLEMGHTVFGEPISKKGDKLKYTVSKMLVLGCNYGMSGPKFNHTCNQRGIDVASVVDPRKAVRDYREKFPEIPAMWRAYHDAVHEAVSGTETFACRCLFYMDRGDLRVRLPSGRLLCYRNARIEPRVPGYCKLFGMPEVPVPTVVFDKPRKGMTGFLYGSKIAENIVQAFCRDLLADAMIRCEQAGIPPVLHVHDELVAEAPPSRFAEFMEIMSTGPAWADGMPILAEGYSGAIWTKAPKGYHEANYLMGSKL